MKEEIELITVVAFDGTTVAVFESTEPDKDIELMNEFNIHLDILSEGTHLTRKEVNNMFINNIVRITPKISWFIMDSDETQLLLDAVADGVELGNINLERND